MLLRHPAQVFGTGLSQYQLTNQEQELFDYTLGDGDQWGVTTHFWITSPGQGANSTIRYYIDGEAEASIAFAPGMACGVGFGDQKAPWGTKWIGKGSARDGWFHNIRIPFYKSLRVTFQDVNIPDGKGASVYLIVRGLTNLPIEIGGIDVPVAGGGVKAVLQRTKGVLQPLDFLATADAPSGSGMLFLSTLAVNSGNLNFLEGCYHFFDGNGPHNATYQDAWPGVTISTGTEDYYDSAWYFSAGQFALPVSGFTHLNTTAHGAYGDITWSAYRFHEMDPLVWNGNGGRFVWRNGDMSDDKGHKCTLMAGGRTNGHPTTSFVESYAWLYTW